jgi:hypothetical protein
MSGLQGDPDKIEPVLTVAEQTAKDVRDSALKAAAKFDEMRRDGSWSDGNAEAAFRNLEQARQNLNGALQSLGLVINEAKGAIAILRRAGG